MSVLCLLVAMVLGVAGLVVVAPILRNDPFRVPPPWRRHG